MKQIAVFSALSVVSSTLAYADAPAARWEAVVLRDATAISLRVCESSSSTASAQIRSLIAPVMPTKKINQLRIGAPLDN